MTVDQFSGYRYIEYDGRDWYGSRAADGRRHVPRCDGWGIDCCPFCSSPATRENHEFNHPPYNEFYWGYVKYYCGTLVAFTSLYIAAVGLSPSCKKLADFLGVGREDTI